MLAILTLAVLRAGLFMGWFLAPETVSLDSLVETAAGASTFATTALSVMLVLNVFLGFFNLLPLPSYDGAGVLSVFLRNSHAQRMREMASNGMMSILGLLVAWQVFDVVRGPLFSGLLLLVHPGESYYSPVLRREPVAAGRTVQFIMA